MSDSTRRGFWSSRLGFILATAGSAVGLGNVWRFPYITGENGGGLFVIVYLLCVFLIGVPIMVAEMTMGRSTRRSVVGTFRKLGGPHWACLGWLGVITSFLFLSFYSVVGGWILHYTVVALRGGFAGQTPEQVMTLFNQLRGDISLNLLWHGLFILLTAGVVAGGVKKGLERLSLILMPLLILMLGVLLVRAASLKGFDEAVSFVFGFHADKLTASGVLDAMGQAFFTLGVGVGGMLTYGSFLQKKANIPGNAMVVSLFDTAIALLACMVVFPIIFTYAMQPDQGPGLIFVNLPMAFAQMPGGVVVAGVFFALLVFATLTSSVSMLEVSTSYFIDERSLPRKRAVLLTGTIVFVLGIPAALTGGTLFFGREWVLGRNWFDMVVDLGSNILLPLGGLGMALFAGWWFSDQARRAEFEAEGQARWWYHLWLFLIRYAVPLAVVAVFLRAIGVF